MNILFNIITIINNIDIIANIYIYNNNDNNDNKYYYYY